MGRLKGRRKKALLTLYKTDQLLKIVRHGRPSEGGGALAEWRTDQTSQGREGGKEQRIAIAVSFSSERMCRRVNAQAQAVNEAGQRKRQDDISGATRLIEASMKAAVRDGFLTC